MIQAAESDLTVYCSCDDYFNQGDNNVEIDQVPENCQDFISNEGKLDREGINPIVHLSCDR